MNKPDQTYLVCAAKSWNRRFFEELTPDFFGTWHFLDEPDALTIAKIAELKPRYIFFPHWSWIVPDEIVDGYECVCFHMTDVPYGRGGSPLQNLIVRGHKETKLTALRMTVELDAGPVYKKTPLSLAGKAQDIYIRAARLSFDLMREIAEHEPAPVPQEGEPVLFKRRKPEDSEIPKGADLSRIYDYIRMLDAEGYPPAFQDMEGGIRAEYRDAEFDGQELSARVTFRKG